MCVVIHCKKKPKRKLQISQNKCLRFYLKMNSRTHILGKELSELNCLHFGLIFDKPWSKCLIFHPDLPNYLFFCINIVGVTFFRSSFYLFIFVSILSSFMYLFSIFLSKYRNITCFSITLPLDI